MQPTLQHDCAMAQTQIRHSLIGAAALHHGDPADNQFAGLAPGDHNAPSNTAHHQVIHPNR